MAVTSFIMVVIFVFGNTAEAAWTKALEPMGANLGLSFASIDWGDYDNDGDLDIAISGRIGLVTSRLYIYRNNGGSFTKVAEPMGVTDGVFYGNVQWGDYDNDGDLDLAVCGYDVSGNQRFIIIRNDGGGVFTNAAEPMGVNKGLVAGALAWGDYDNDGDLDIVLSGESSSFSTISTKRFRNDGGTFNEVANTGIANIGRGKVSWGDYDNDGDLDLAISGIDNGGSPRLVIYRNDGNGSFVNAAEPMGAPASRGIDDFQWGDYDNDGDLDLVVCGSYSLIIYRNDGNNVFTKVAEPMGANLGVTVGSVRWGDYDNDGDLDLLVSGCYGVSPYQLRLIIYRNDGGNSFVKAAEPMGADLGVSNSSARWGDYDGDGDLDFAVAGDPAGDCSDTRFIVFRSDVNGAVNVRPATPSLTLPVDSSIIAYGDTITFRWADSAGDATPTPAMTYNLRIGTTPDGVEISSADTDSGDSIWNAILGNVQNDTFAWINGIAMPPGTYYWSVQAVDGGQMVSGWSTARTVIISNDTTAATLTVITPTEGEKTNTTTVTVSGTVQDDQDTPTIVWYWVNGVFTDTSSITDGAYVDSLTLPATGSNVITVGCTDSMGRFTSDSRTVILDTGIPSITIDSPSNDQTIVAGQTEVVVFGTVADDYDTPTEVALFLNGTSAGTMPVSNGTFSGTVPLVAEGYYIQTVSCTDGAGNADAETVGFNYDTGPPLLWITYPADNIETNAEFIILAGVVADSYSVPTYLVWSLNGGDTRTISNNSWETGIILTADTNVITVSCSDAAGNYTQISLTIGCDTTPPTLSLDYPNDGHDTSTAWIPLTGTVGDNYDTPTYLVVSTNYADTRTISNSIWDTGIILVDDTNIVTVGCSDAAGNYVQTSVVIGCDTVPPGVTIAYPTGGQETLATWVSLSGTVTDNKDTPTYLIVSINYADTRIVNNNLWDTGLTLILDTNIITVGCSDAVGNYAQVSILIAVDTTAPVVSVFSPFDGSDTGSLIGVVNGQVTDNFDTPVYVWLSIGGYSDTALVDPTGNYGGTLPLASGFNIVTVSCSDPMGNYASETVGINCDTGLPDLQIQLPAEGTDTCDPNIFLVGSVTDNTDTPTEVTIILNGTYYDTAVVVDGVFGCSMTLPALGYNVITVTCTDGSLNNTTDSTGITYDTGPPTVTILNLPEASDTNAGVMGLSGRITDDFDTPGFVIVTWSGLSDTVPVDADGYFNSQLPLAPGYQAITVSCTDGAGNSGFDTVGVYCDTELPVVTITNIVEGEDTNAAECWVFGWISDIYDTPGTVVLIAAGAPNSVVVDGFGNFSGTVTLAPGYGVITAGCTDSVGNTGSDTVGIYYDTGGPAVTILVPVNNADTNQLTIPVIGTVNDNYDTVTEVTIIVTGMAGETVLVVAGGYSTAITVPTSGVYSITATCTDAIGNTGTATVSITVDTQPPSITITTPLPETDTKAIEVEVVGRVTDDYDTPGMAIISANGYWFAAAVDATGNFSGTVPLVAGYSVITVSCSDASGNNTQETIGLNCDTAPPGISSGAIVINGDTDYVGGVVVSLAIAYDSTAAQMQLSEDPLFAGAIWQALADSVLFTLSSGSDTKTVYVRFSDTVGNVSASDSDAILLDTGAPIIRIALLNNGDTTTGATAIMVYTAVDDSSPVTGIQLSENPDFSGATWQTYAETIPFSLTAVAGFHTVYVKVRDSVGNESDSVARTITYDLSSPIIEIINPDSIAITVASETFTGIIYDSSPLSDTMLVIINSVDQMVVTLTGNTFQFAPTFTTLINTMVLTVWDCYGNQGTLERTVLFPDNAVYPTETTVILGQLDPAAGSVVVRLPGIGTHAVAFPIYNPNGSLYDTWTVEMATKDTGVNFAARAVDPDSYYTGTDQLYRWDELSYTIVEFMVFDDTGTNISDSIAEELNGLWITFHVSPQVLQTLPNNEIAHLKLFWFNENSGKWDPYGTTTVDAENGIIRARIDHHLSIWGVFSIAAFAAPAANLANVTVYPNPYVPNDGLPENGIPFAAQGDGSGVYINGLVPGSEIKIYGSSSLSVR